MINKTEMMKTLSKKNYKKALLNIFTNSRSLAGTISKWVTSNSVVTFKLNNELLNAMHN